MGSLKDKCAITGVGWTQISRNSGRTTLSMAAEACKKAIDDAGLKPKDIDGLLTYNMYMWDDTAPQLVANCLGIPNLRYFTEHGRVGGTVSQMHIGTAAAAIMAGMAHNVIVYRSMNGRSGFRVGRTGVRGPTINEAQFYVPFGYSRALECLAMWTRRHMIKYGTTKEQLGAVAIALRKWGTLNEKALLRTPLTMEEYLNAPIYADPISLLDMCIEADGAFAEVISSAKQARDLRHPPVYIMAVMGGSGPDDISGPSHGGPGIVFRYEEHADFVAKYWAPELFHMAGITPKDIDVAEIYDENTLAIIQQLEAYGFCKPGEGAAFVESGNINLGGKLPVTTNGGYMNEGYFHGVSHAVEAVVQLRGDAGKRQVPGAEIALATAVGISTANAVILRR